MSANYWQTKDGSSRLARRRLLRLGAAISFGAVAAVACGQSRERRGGGVVGGRDTSSFDGGTPSPMSGASDFTPGDGPPRPGGRYLDTWTSQSGWNPVTQEAEGTGTGGRFVYDRLLTSREGERRYNLEAARSVELVDPVTVVFKLKPGMTFHDVAPVNGRPLVAADVVASQEYVVHAPEAFDRVFARDVLERAEAPDELTVIYHLRQPSAYLFSRNLLGSGTGQCVLAPETFASLDDGPSVGSGPYVLDAAHSQLSVSHRYRRFSRFREAQKGQPHPDEAEVRFISESADLEAAFRAGQIDRWPGPGPGTAQAVARELGDAVRLLQFAGLGSWAWHMQMATEKGLPWSRDARVREAFWRLTNQQQHLDLVWQGNGAIPPGLLPAALEPWQLERSEVDAFYQEDIARAKQLLAAAHFDFDRGFDLIGNRAGSQDEQGALLWQKQLSRAGIKTSVSTVADTAHLVRRWSEGDWELMVQSSPGSEAPGRVLRNLHSQGWSDSFTNFGLMDPEIDRLIERSETLVDPAENVRAVKEIQLLAIQRFSSFYQLISPNEHLLLSGRVQRFELTRALPSYQLNMWLKQD